MSNLEYNRRATQDDFLKQTNEVRDERRDVPLSDILDAPLLCLRFNEEWKSHILGAVSTLQKWSAWIGNEDDTNTGTRQITKFLAQDFNDCGDCSIEDLLADDTFFYDEYLPQTFGTKYSNTQTRNDDLETSYDGTPQSIGSNIPTGTPNEAEKNALCAALMRFVRLYCSEKICVLQSRNFLEVAWQNVEDAAESFYGSTLDQMLGNWSDNLFGCIVDVPTALIALADESAQEDLVCFLLDELDGSAISESAFNTAIDNAALSLSGNAQDIACVMSEDYAVFVALNFFQAYSTALIQQENNEEVDCPCISTSYRHWSWDFANGMGPFRWLYSGTNQWGTLSGGVLLGSTIGSNKEVSVTMDLDPTWRIRGARVLYTREGTSPGNFIMRWRPTPDNNTAAQNPSIGSGGAVSPWSSACQYMASAPGGYISGFKQFFLFAQSGGTTSVMKVKSVEIIYMDGFDDGGYPTTDDDMCT